MSYADKFTQEVSQADELTQEVSQADELTQEVFQADELTQEVPRADELPQEVPQADEFTQEVSQPDELTQEVPQPDADGQEEEDERQRGQHVVEAGVGRVSVRASDVTSRDWQVAKTAARQVVVGDARDVALAPVVDVRLHRVAVYWVKAATKILNTAKKILLQYLRDTQFSKSWDKTRKKATVSIKYCISRLNTVMDKMYMYITHRCIDVHVHVFRHKH